MEFGILDGVQGQEKGSRVKPCTGLWYSEPSTQPWPCAARRHNPARSGAQVSNTFQRVCAHFEQGLSQDKVTKCAVDTINVNISPSKGKRESCLSNVLNSAQPWRDHAARWGSGGDSVFTYDE
jgi:hypothetical protein